MNGWFILAIGFMTLCGVVSFANFANNDKLFGTFNAIGAGAWFALAIKWIT